MTTPDPGSVPPLDADADPFARTLNADTRLRVYRVEAPEGQSAPLGLRYVIRRETGEYVGEELVLTPEDTIWLANSLLVLMLGHPERAFMRRAASAMLEDPNPVQGYPPSRSINAPGFLTLGEALNPEP